MSVVLITTSEKDHAQKKWKGEEKEAFIIYKERNTVILLA